MTSDDVGYRVVEIPRAFKDLEADRLHLRRAHSSNLLVIIHSVVLYDGDVQEFLPAFIRYARKSLYFIFSVDAGRSPFSSSRGCVISYADSRRLEIQNDDFKGTS